MDTTQQTLTQSKIFTMPAVLLRLEGFIVLAVSIVLYWQFTDASGWLFIALLLVPDFAMLPYLINPQWGAISYNIVHSYTLPVTLAIVALLAGWTFGLALALIWTAHISMDRTVGYGLKYSLEFKDTHLGRV